MLKLLGKFTRTLRASIIFSLSYEAKKNNKAEKTGLSLSDNERANVVLGCINVTPTATGYLYKHICAKPSISVSGVNKGFPGT